MDQDYGFTSRDVRKKMKWDFKQFVPFGKTLPNFYNMPKLDESKSFRNRNMRLKYLTILSSVAYRLKYIFMKNELVIR